MMRRKRQRDSAAASATKDVEDIKTRAPRGEKTKDDKKCKKSKIPSKKPVKDSDSSDFDTAIMPSKRPKKKADSPAPPLPATIADANERLSAGKLGVVAPPTASLPPPTPLQPAPPQATVQTSDMTQALLISLLAKTNDQVSQLQQRVSALASAPAFVQQAVPPFLPSLAVPPQLGQLTQFSQLALPASANVKLQYALISTSSVLSGNAPASAAVCNFLVNVAAHDSIKASLDFIFHIANSLK
jgi:hypothetical protein